MFHAMPLLEKEEAMVSDAFEKLEELIEEIIGEDLKWLTE